MSHLSDPSFMLLAILGVLCTGISKSGFAGGAGVLAVPLLALVVSPTFAVVFMLPLLLLMDAQTIAYHRRRLDWSELGKLIPSALCGVMVGSALLGKMSDALLQFSLGLLSLGFAWMQVFRRAGQQRNQNGHAVWAIALGGTAGVTSSLIHSGGPPLNMYLARRQLSRAAWISTAAVFFACINLAKVFSYGWNDLWRQDLLLLSAVFVPVAALGVYLGHRLQTRLSEAQFLRVVMLALAGSGVMLILKAVY